MRTAFAKGLRHLFLGVSEAVHELPVAHRLFHRIQIGALDVFDDRQLQHFSVGQLPDQDRNFMNLS